MPISESQLQTWSNQGATVSSTQTYASIKRALKQHTWSTGLSCDVYLQGSYANTTNTRGNSDVDIVVECTSVFYHNVTDRVETESLNFLPALYSYEDFRNEVITALTSYYGFSMVDSSGANAIEVLSDGNRLKADVLSSHTCHDYESARLQSKGICYFNHHNHQQIVNYPKQHIENGEAKNSYYRTGGRYKSSVRMFKNIREYIIGNDILLRKKFPSYFVECLFYNVPDLCFQYNYQDTFIKAVGYLAEEFSNGNAKKFTTQSEHHWLFGVHSVQWSYDDANYLINRFIEAWESF